MNHAFAVGVGEGVANLLEDGEQAAKGIFRHGFRHAFSDEFDHLFQRDALHQFHRVKGLPRGVHAEIVDRHDVRVLELGGDLRLLDEARGGVGIALVVHDFHGHRASRRALPRGKDHTHAAPGDFLFHIEMLRLAIFQGKIAADDFRLVDPRGVPLEGLNRRRAERRGSRKRSGVLAPGPGGHSVRPAQARPRRRFAVGRAGETRSSRCRSALFASGQAACRGGDRFARQ